MEDLNAISSIIGDITLNVFMLFVLIRVDKERRELLHKILTSDHDDRTGQEETH